MFNVGQLPALTTHPIDTRNFFMVHIMLKGSAFNDHVMMTDLPKKWPYFCMLQVKGVLLHCTCCIYRTGLTWKDKRLRSLHGRALQCLLGVLDKYTQSV